MAFERGNPNTSFGRYTTPTALISAAQNFTNAWAALGSEIDCRGYRQVGAFLKLTVNSSSGMRFRVMGRHTSASSDLFPLPIKVTSATSVSVAPEYVEMASDASQNIVFSWDVGNLIPYVVIQVEVGTVGATAAQVATAHYSRSY